jgi:hypothetical protein
MPQFLGYAELIFDPPAFSLIEFGWFPVNKVSQIFATVLVTVIFDKRKRPDFQSVHFVPRRGLFPLRSNVPHTTSGV